MKSPSKAQAKAEAEYAAAWPGRWAGIVKLEPRLGQLERAIRRVRDNHARRSFCGTDVYMRRFAWQLERLCGGEATRAPQELQDFWLFQDVNDYLLDLLPPCRNCDCCDSETVGSTRRAFTAEQRAVLFEMADGLCQWCGDDLGGDWHADHIHPWSKGGMTEIDNGQALCAPCNMRKGARLAPLDSYFKS